MVQHNDHQRFSICNRQCFSIAHCIIEFLYFHCFHMACHLFSHHKIFFRLFFCFQDQRLFKTYCQQIYFLKKSLSALLQAKIISRHFSCQNYCFCDQFYFFIMSKNYKIIFPKNQTITTMEISTVWLAQHCQRFRVKLKFVISIALHPFLLIDSYGQLE